MSRLVIIHEEGEAGHEMPDLSRPVQAVSNAVTNLVKVKLIKSMLTDTILFNTLTFFVHMECTFGMLIRQLARLLLLRTPAHTCRLNFQIDHQTVTLLQDMLLY